jgi:2'-5' RNA ligase
MQQVSPEVAARLREMAQSPPPRANSRSLQRLAWHLTARASGHAREAAIQRGNSGRR